VKVYLTPNGQTDRCLHVEAELQLGLEQSRTNALSVNIGQFAELVNPILIPHNESDNTATNFANGTI
jgi:hypothetical protein